MNKMTRQLEQGAGNVRMYASGGEIKVVDSREGWVYKAPLRALSVVQNVDVIGLLFKINQSRG